MTSLNEKTSTRIAYETNALMTKMVRTRQLRLDGKTATPAYAKAIESIRKTKALCHKLRLSLHVRSLKARAHNTELNSKLFDIADKVHSHALKNYNTGWDGIVESYSAADIVDVLRQSNITSLRAALKHFGKNISVANDVALDHQLEAASGQ